MSNDNKGGGFFNNPTRKVGGADATVKNDDPANAKTRAVHSPQETAPTQSTESTGNQQFDQRTRRVRPGASSEDVGAQSASAATGGDYQPEFTVGWLVITDGPGKGASKPLGYGINPVGREEEAGVRLDYGDEEISRKAHCQIAYDHKNSKFFIQQGGGQNLTYLGDNPVLSPMELESGAQIAIGNTSLRFVPLCGDGFDWEDQG